MAQEMVPWEFVHYTQPRNHAKLLFKNTPAAMPQSNRKMKEKNLTYSNNINKRETHIREEL